MENNNKQNHVDVKASIIRMLRRDMDTTITFHLPESFEKKQTDRHAYLCNKLKVLSYVIQMIEREVPNGK